ncbi:MAG: Xaa-Pro peptidase family protein [candidate division KSB1 bacterium]|nr:Xaa-Pro peptidase family protein [candidate division KSB1 bacterium]
MMSSSERKRLINEKIRQAAEICREKGIDVWLTFVRETASTPDPILDLILGTGCTWQSAFLISATGRAVALVGSLDAQNIRDHADYEVLTYVASMREELLRLLREFNPASIAVNYSLNDPTADGLTHGMYLMLCDYLRDTPFLSRLISSESLIAALRGRKTPAELELIKEAVAETLDILQSVTSFVRIGMSEKEIAEFIKSQIKARGLEPAWEETHCPAVFTGPDTAGAHAGPTERLTAPGHVMNIDFGVRKEGYAADLQRTWYFLRPGEEKPPAEVLRGFATVREAIRRAAEFLRPGRLGWEVDHVARRTILDAGYEEYPHALGHQVGRKAHDGGTLLCPRWERYKDLPYSVVEEGQVFTLEPRLTIAGYGIATIEEMVVVKAQGSEFLSDPQDEIWIIDSEQ